MWCRCGTQNCALCQALALIRAKETAEYAQRITAGPIEGYWFMYPVVEDPYGGQMPFVPASVLFKSSKLKASQAGRLPEPEGNDILLKLQVGFLTGVDHFILVGPARTEKEAREKARRECLGLL